MLCQCAWCGAWMGQTEPLEISQITHGMCPACAEVLWREIEEAMTAQKREQEEPIRRLSQPAAVG